MLGAYGVPPAPGALNVLEMAAKEHRKGRERKTRREEEGGRGTYTQTIKWLTCVSMLLFKVLYYMTVGRRRHGRDTVTITRCR